MSYQIILYLQSSNKSSWAYVKHNRIFKKIINGDLSQLKQKTNQSLTVIVPSENLLITKVNLSKLSHQQLKSTLMRVIEDQLLEPTEELDITTGLYEKNGWPVIVMDKKIKKGWHDLLKKYHLTPNVIVPSLLAIPLVNESNLIYQYQHECLIRTDLFSGFQCHVANVNLYLTETSIQPIDEETLLELFFSTLQKFPYINLLKRNNTFFKKIFFGFFILSSLMISFLCWKEKMKPPPPSPSSISTSIPHFTVIKKIYLPLSVSHLPLKLTGIINGSSPLAIVKKTNSSNENLYRPGEKLLKGVYIDSIRKQSVIINNNGNQEVLRF